MQKFYNLKVLFLAVIVFISSKTRAQELFVFTEPASNMPTNSVGLRLGNSFSKPNEKSNYDLHLMPEIMWGVNKNLMLHFTLFLSNQTQNLNLEGESFYAKYRIFSVDDLHSHFRLAIFGKYSLNNSEIHQEEIEIMGHNSGFETGIVATQLINKIAISSSVSFEKALKNNPNYDFPTSQNDNAMNYTLSFGKLIYPKKYTSFKQTNLNLMVEFLGQRLNQNGKSFLDVAPSVQFIINSQARLDLAYRKEIYSNMSRNGSNEIYIKLEYTFFNIFN